MKKAVLMTAFWISLALVFNLGIYFYLGEEAALNFLAGYLIEESLSIDNLFVFFAIFKYFETPKSCQPKVLYWGVIGAIVMRILFILLGIALIKSFHWILYLFGLFLLYAAIKIAMPVEGIKPEANPVLKLLRKWLPITPYYVKNHFFVRLDGVLYATPLFIVLLSVEMTDLLFAMDSIPAVIAITRDPFIIITSNVFAILGLRSIYFLLENFLSYFHLLHYGLALILAFAGLKILLEPFYTIPIFFSLGFICLVLIVTATASLLYVKPKP